MSEAESNEWNKTASLNNEMLEITSVDKQYAVQYFGFTVESYINEVHDIIHKNFYEIFETYCDRFKHQFHEIMTNEELNEAHDIVSNKFLDRLQLMCDKLEIYLAKNIFHVPSNVLLPEDKIQENVCPAFTEEELDKEIEEKIQQLKNIKSINACMEQKLCDLNRIEKKYEEVCCLNETLSKEYTDNFLSSFSNLEKNTITMFQLLTSTEKFLINKT